MQMSTRGIVGAAAFTAAACSAVVFGQAKPAATSASGVHEFPVTMRQKVVAGTTPVGTKVEAKLAMATLLDGTVIPVGATFSGEVIESAAKSAADPSRLAIRMDSVRWKKGSASIKAYLTAWYYPIRVATDEAPLDEPLGSPAGRRRGGTGTYNPNSSGSQPFPGNSAPNGLDLPRVPASNISDNRVAMKDVQSTQHKDGAVALTSIRFNIKLDKSTTYVLATGGPAPAK
jgi:hypothetical protein